MAKKAKKPEKVVVNATYFELIERKARLLDEMFGETGVGFTVTIERLKEHAQIQKAYEKANAYEHEGIATPYEEPLSE